MSYDFSFNFRVLLVPLGHLVLLVHLVCKECLEKEGVLINPKYSLEGLMLKVQYFGHLMQRADSLKKTLMLGKIEGRRRWG